VAQLTDKTSSKAAALMTAESVIIAFLFAYAPLFSSTLVSLITAVPQKPYVTTVWAGLAVFGLILTGFRSIMLLYQSIDSDIEKVKLEKYTDGRDLFLAVILGSSFYAVLSIASILKLAATGSSFDFPMWTAYVWLLLIAVGLILIWFHTHPFMQGLRELPSQA
jgi:hypothetical protein